MIIFGIIGIFLTAVAISGLLFFVKCRPSVGGTSSDQPTQNKRLNQRRGSSNSSSMASEVDTQSEMQSQASEFIEPSPSVSTINPSDFKLNSNVASNNIESAKPKRTGYSKQQFYEFEWDSDRWSSVEYIYLSMSELHDYIFISLHWIEDIHQCSPRMRTYER